MSDKQSSTFDRIVNIGLLVVIAFLLVSPRSVLRTAFDAWRADARSSALVESNWERIAATTSRMDSVVGDPPLLVEFGDYECPFCRLSHPALEKLIASHAHITIGYRHFPLTNLHPSAEPAAYAAICAERQARFPQMHSLLMTTTGWTETDDWISLAEQAEVPNVRRRK
jgi:protein-disulfide isomerase